MSTVPVRDMEIIPRIARVEVVLLLIADSYRKQNFEGIFFSQDYLNTGMPLQGFHLASVIGWVSGVIILPKPWGTPNFRWLCIPTFIAVFYTILVVCINVVAINQTKSYSNNNIVYAFSKRVDKLVTQLSYFQLILSSLVIRFIFLYKARKVADLLQRLRKYNTSRSKTGVIGNGSRSRSRSPSTFADCAVTHLVFFSTFSLGVADAYVAYHFEGDRLWFQGFGNLVHGILLVIIVVIPLMAPVQCAFSLTVHSLAHLSELLQDYCQHVLSIIPNGKGISIIHSKHESKVDLNHPYYFESIFSQNSKQKVFFTNKFRVEILARFEDVRSIFHLADEIISPMALLLLACSSISVVMKAYELIVLYKNIVNVIRTLCHIVNYLSYFWILHSGQRIKETVSECKDKLKKALAELSTQTGEMERQTIKDVLSMISLWDWKFKACNFFVIDKKLASGIVSLIMTYTVVLVQLKISEASKF